MTKKGITVRDWIALPDEKKPTVQRNGRTILFGKYREDLGVWFLVDDIGFIHHVTADTRLSLHP